MSVPAPRGGPPLPIPLVVVTGFLGAGKTTLLNRLLRDPSLTDTVVIVNEFGDVGIDHLLVESSPDGIVLLSAGCLCCTVRGDLVQTLEDLLRRRDNGRITPFRRVVIETTGLADPAPVLAAVLFHPYLSRRYAIDAVVTVVSAVHGRDALARHPEARRQVAVADRIVVSKGDLSEADARGALEGELRALNPGAPILHAVSGALAADVLLGDAPNGAFTPDGKIADVAAWLRAEEHAHAGHHHHGHDPHHHHRDVSRHDARIGSVVLTADAPIAESGLDLFLDTVRSAFGPRILRLKGLVALRRDPDRPLVIQGVQHVIHVPAILPAWPDDDHRTRIVMILDDVPRDAVLRLWNAFAGVPAPDQPDASALMDNPLAPPTLAC